MPLLRCAVVAIACLAGCDSIKNIPRPLAKSATLDLFLVSANPVPGSVIAIDPGTKSTIFLMTPAIISTADVATIQRSGDSSETPELTVNLTTIGTQRLEAATAKAIGRQIAFVINGTVVSVPRLNSPLTGSFSLTAGDVAWRENLLRDLTETP